MVSTIQKVMTQLQMFWFTGRYNTEGYDTMPCHCHAPTHARCGLPIDPDSNPTPPNRGASGLHDTAAIAYLGQGLDTAAIQELSCCWNMPFSRLYYVLCHSNFTAQYYYNLFYVVTMPATSFTYLIQFKKNLKVLSPLVRRYLFDPLLWSF